MPPNDEYEKIADLFGYQEYEGDLEEKDYALAILMLLEIFYRKYESKSISYYEKHFNEDCQKLEKKILDKNEKYFNKYAESKKKEQLLYHNIPSSKHNKIDLKLNLKTTKTVVETTIKNIFNQLRDEVDLKIKVWEDHQEKDSTFTVKSKLNDAVKRTKRTIAYSTNTIHQKTVRKGYEFRYGTNAKYYWVCKDDEKTCAWCRQQSKEPPRKMEDWELDHVHGRCSFKPANEEATQLYNEIVGVYE